MSRGLVTLLAAVAVGCSSASSGSAASTTSGVVPGRVSLPAGDETTTTSAASAASAASAVTLDRAALAAACEEYVPLAAFTGDVQMQALWTAVGQDANALAVRCADLAETDSARLAAMAADLVRLRAELESVTTDATAGSPGTAGSAPAPDPAPPTTVDEEPESATTDATVGSVPAPAPDPAPPATVGVVMPRVLCSPLHDALAQLEAVGVVAPITFDASGAGRRPVDDGTWVVATQSPGAGRTVSAEETRLGVVRAGEPSPC